MNPFYAVLWLGWFGSLGLMAGATWNDHFIDWEADWLTRHKSMWARRDWHIIAYHVFVLPILVETAGWWTPALLATSAGIHYFVFVQVYGCRAAVKNAQYVNDTLLSAGKPHWGIWRFWQIAPGLSYGTILALVFEILTGP